MIFNGNRSYIHSEDSLSNGGQPYKLFIEKKGEHNSLVKSLILLEENLMKINRGLALLTAKENIGFQSQSNTSDEEFFYPNRIIRLLHKIGDFQ